MEVKLASAMSRLGTETAFEVLAKARALEAQGRQIIHLEIGEPDFDTPEHIVEAGKALRDGHTHYTPAAGHPALREAIAADVERDAAASPVDPEQVVVTPGGKPVMFYTILALCEAGDEVLFPNPGFPIYESMINFVGGKPVRPAAWRRRVPPSTSTSLKSRASRPAPELVILNSPANPTGGVIPPSDFEAWPTSLRERRRLMLSATRSTPPSLRGRAAVDRVGARHGGAHDHPRRLLQDLGDDRLAARLRRHAARPGRDGRQTDGQLELLHRRVPQWAGVEAITGPQDAVDRCCAEFRARRDLIVAASMPSRRRLRDAGGRVLRLPQYHRHRPLRARARGPLALRGGRGDPRGHVVWGEYGRGLSGLSYANSMENLNEAVRASASSWSRSGRPSGRLADRSEGVNRSRGLAPALA